MAMGQGKSLLVHLHRANVPVMTGPPRKIIQISRLRTQLFLAQPLCPLIDYLRTLEGRLWGGLRGV